MMSKKPINIILIVCLLIIWFFVFKNFFNVVNANVDAQESFAPATASNLIASKKGKDTFNLKNISRDPFQSDQSRSGTTQNIRYNKPSRNTKPVITKKVSQVKANTNWPKLTYHGFVKASNSESRLALVKIDNKLMRIRINEMLNGEIKLTDIQPDSIIVIMENIAKTVKRSK